jgi:hypothetical protein
VVSIEAAEPNVPVFAAGSGDPAVKVAAELATTGHTVELPPYVVSAMRVQKSLWRYAALPGFEVLTRASEDDTYWLLDALRRGQWLEDHVLPPEWLHAAPVPYTVIIDDADLDKIRSTEMHAEPIVFREPPDAFSWGIPTVNLWTNHFQASDSDTFALNANVRDVDTGTRAYGWVSIERLARCAPALPPWLLSGLLDEQFGFFREGFTPLVGPDPNEIRTSFRPNSTDIRRVVGPGTLWLSIGETKRLQEMIAQDKRNGRSHEVKIETKIPLLPLSQLLADPIPTDENRMLWKSEAALFVRWGISGAESTVPRLKDQFVRFVERARREPVTEAMFTECFGVGFAAVEAALDAYLRRVIAQPISFDPGFPTAFPSSKTRRATADQIGRILGDWLRMQSRSSREQDPEMSGQLLNAAGQMLVRAYRIDNGLPPDADPTGGAAAVERTSDAKPGERVVTLQPLKVAAPRIHDPDLLGTFGLYEHDAGHDEEARGYLERAARGGAVRPQARIVLAQLRYAEALEKPAGPDGKFSAPQAAYILERLEEALRVAPNLDVHLVVVNTWYRCAEKPPHLDLTRMADAAALYPRYTALAYRTAELCLISGECELAGRLADQGLKFANDDKTRADFEGIRAAIAAAAKERTAR